MKHFLLYFFALLQINLFSQTANGTTPAADNVIKLDPRTSQFDFVPGQILIKLKDDVKVSLAKVNGVTVMGVASIDAVLQKHNMQKAEKLFPNEKRSFNKRMLKTSNGKEFVQPNLHNIYKVEGDSTLNIFEVIDELKEDPNVEYAEPNYILSIVESKPVSPALNESEMIEWIKEHPEVNVANSSALLMTNDQQQKPNVVTPNDPLYPQQWGIPATQVDAVWDSTTGDTTQLIAILDTGVDWLHPDLKNKIWTNPNEIPDNGVDDDGNGYVDDVRGWDFINWDNNPLDDNGHGTHVAGIAAAEGNNGIGIAGVNWKAKILPIKVFQSSGRGDASTIARGIIYATQKGATIINMSFGGYFKSSTMESALLNAVLTSELVAAAGNDHLSIYPKSPNPGDASTMYPAAFSFVLGVQVVEDFSNYDPDGPVYSTFISGENYELISYGGGIMSTYPGGKYRSLSGTSMGAPLVSGIIALYNSQKREANKEDRWADFINLSTPVNAYMDIFSKVRKPVFDLRTFEITDTLSGNDFDNQADAGETIHLWARIRNTFGNADSTFIKLQLSDVSRPYYNEHITFIKDVAYLGSMSSYREGKNQYDPFVFYLKPTFPNEQKLEMELLMWDATKADTFKQTFDISVFNGTELSGLLTGNLVLTPDRTWAINNSTRLTTGSTMSILPGTHLIINGSFDNRGTIEAIGKPDSMIIIEKNGNLNALVNKYVVFNLVDGDLNGGIFENCFINNCRLAYGRFLNCNFNGVMNIFTNTLENCIIQNLAIVGSSTQGALGVTDTVRNCIFTNLISDYGLTGSTYYFEKNLFINNIFTFGLNFDANDKFKHNIFQGFTNIYVWSYPTWPNLWPPGRLFDVNATTYENYYGNVFLVNNNIKFFYLFHTQGSENEIPFPNQYFGTSNRAKINKWIIDFNDNAGLPLASLTPMMIPPSDSAHGFVWKVLVNGKDAQDEVVEPVGVGQQRFDIYFNRQMDINYTPNLSFGGIFPYNSRLVADSSSWSTDHKIWTTYYNVKLYTGDGINRIRVSGAKDLEGFEIPVEDQRFEFLISAAGSSSLDFAATAGLGKVNLEWSNPQDVPDLLGYNMYRLEHINDSTLTQPIMINTSLINDTLFTDFNVIPNKKYYYYYRTVRTDFSESDSSRVVSTTPYTAALGDGNGDLTVNVLDVLGTVSYILGQNPQPFIFDAADVVRDSIINVLDVVGNVNIILKGTLLKNYLAKTSYGNAKVEFTGNEVYLTTDQPVAGIQLQFKGKGLKDKKFIYSGSANFENMSSSLGDTTQIALMYSLNKNEFAPGKYLIGRIEGDAKGISLSDAVLSDNEGGKINLNLIDNGVSTIPENYYLDQNYPNPFNLSTTIQYGIPAKTVGKIVIYNILGQQVRTFDLGEREAGRYKLIWDGKNNYGSVISTGVYIFRFESVKFTSAKKMILLK